MKSSNETIYYLIFDTNALFQAYEKKADFTTFSFNATYENVIDMINKLDIYNQVTVAIPSVVWNEMEKQIIEKHDELLLSYRNTITKKLFPEYSIIENPTINYPEYIKTKIVEYKEEIAKGLNKVIEIPVASKMAYPKFQEKLQVCKDLLHGFDFSGFIGGTPLTMAKLITGGVNFILDAHAPERKDLFLKEAMLLKQSHSLCSSMTTKQERHEAAYMEALRSTVIKITYGGTGGKSLSLNEINNQINELLKAAVQSEGVISLFDSTKSGGENFSLFDPAVLDEISRMKEKNIAVEILKKLMAEQVSLYRRTNVVQSQKFSEKITQLMNSYYNGLITNEEVIKELLKTAQEIAELYKNGKKLGLSQEELAFYDALTKPEHIKDFYQNEDLIALTKELTEMLRKNRTIDWQKKETARAQMRKMVKRLLKKYKYPPEDYDYAINTVISQCELWTDNVEPRKEEKLYKFVSERELAMVADERTPYGSKE